MMGVRGLIVVLAVGLPAIAGGCNDSASTDKTAAVGRDDERPWLVDRTIESGIEFVNDAGATGNRLLPEIMGAGVGLFDYDGDGDLDVYLVNGNRSLRGAKAMGSSASEIVTNRLYRQDADGRFTDVTASSGLGDGGFGMGLAVGDVDNDGDADVYVTNFGPDRLYLNGGDGTFEDVTVSAGIDVPGWSCSAAFFDYDRDGLLDLYVTQYVVFDPSKRCLNHSGEPIYCGPKAFAPVHDVLLRNTGQGRFVDVSEAAGIGIGAVAGAGLGVVCEDFNDDGWIDVYVANDADPNHLWVNRRDGTFEDLAVQLGAAYNLHGQPEAGMGVVADDLGNRGVYDLFVTHLVGETNTLYRRRGAGFVDFTGPAGLGPSSQALTGFGTCAFDIELDGDLDLAVANGRVRRGPLLSSANVGPTWNPLAEPNLVYLNDGSGRFDIAAEPAFCQTTEISRGLAMGDIDGDGDLDLLLGNVESPARLYVNEGPRSGHWLIVRAVDPRWNRDALGARVTVEAGGRTLTRSIRRSAGYLSSHDPRAHFGFGEAEQVESLIVRWPDGTKERFGPPEYNHGIGCVDCVVELRRGEGARL